MTEVNVFLSMYEADVLTAIVVIISVQAVFLEIPFVFKPLQFLTVSFWLLNHLI